MCRVQKSGTVEYNGRTFGEFLPQSASVYIEQEDNHLPELTVRETLDFSALCQGAGHKKGSRPSGSSGANPPLMAPAPHAVRKLGPAAQAPCGVWRIADA